MHINITKSRTQYLNMTMCFMAKLIQGRFTCFSMLTIIYLNTNLKGQKRLHF